MARKSKADRINEVLRLNPALSRNDPRISELIDAEALLRKAQRAAMSAPVTVETRNGGTKRSPELISVESANAAVRRLRNDLGIDRVNVKRSEAAGLKVKRSPEADKLLSLYGADYGTHRGLLPGLAAFLTAHGIGPQDMPEHSREVFVSDVAEQGQLVDGVRYRIKGT